MSLASAADVEYRALGNTGMSVSLLGLGTVKLGRDQQVRYPHPFQIPDDAAALRLLDCAADLGINLLDTAPAYGSSEARIGQLLRGRREHWLICTKVGEIFEAGRSRYDFSPEHVAFSVRRSLMRLRTDRLDIVLIHSDGRDREVLGRLGTLEALRSLQQAGLVRAIGISHKSADGAARAVKAGCQVIMATLNADHRDEAAVIAQAGQAGCGVLVKKALGSGHASIESLRYVAAQPGVSAIVVGTVDPEHLRQNAALLDAAAPAT